MKKLLLLAIILTGCAEKPKLGYLQIEQKEYPTYQSVAYFFKSMEWLKLEAYLCPAGVKTIGWGDTNVKKNKITLSEANTYFVNRIDADFKEIKLLFPKMPKHRQYVMLNCKYNYTTKSFKQLCKYAESGELPYMLPKYVCGAGNELQGLKIRVSHMVKLWDDPMYLDDNIDTFRNIVIKIIQHES